MVETNTAVIIRQQGWFRPFVNLENLTPFPTDKIDLVPFDTIGGFRGRLLIGRGPVERDLFADVSLWFEHGEKDYPVFECPSIGPMGAGLFSTRKNHHLSVSEDEALALVEISILQPVVPTFQENYEASPADTAQDSPARIVQKLLAEAKVWLEQAIGLYALYQFPVVWEQLGSYPLVAFVDLQAKTIKGTTTFHPDNFIPFRLRLDSKVKDGQLVDDGLVDFSRLATLKMHFPLLLLQRALWQRNIQLRFLETFLVLDYLASQSTIEDSDRKNREDFYEIIFTLVEQNHSEYLDRVKSLKHIVLQAPLIERLTLYLKSLTIEIDGPLFRKMLKTRNDLAHARPVDVLLLTQLELELRRLTREALRRDLAQKGVKFGDTAA